MTTTSPPAKKQKTDHDIESETQLLMKHYSMTREMVDALSNEMRTTVLSTVNTLLEKSKQKDEEIQTLLEENKQKDEEKRTLLEESKEKDARLESQGTYSLRRLVDTDKLPEVQFVTNGYSPLHTASAGKHGKALPVQREAKVQLQEIVVNKDKVLDFPSRLLYDLIENNTGTNDRQKLKVHYINRADVSSYITSALKDAMKLAKDSTGLPLSCFHEASLWSNRGDHLVVWNEETKTPIIAVGAKLPMGKTLDGSLPPEPVIGEVFDYLMELRCLGQSAPFVILSTLTSSWMFWESNDGETNNLVLAKSNLETLKERTSSLRQNLGTSTSEKTPSRPDLTVKQETFTTTNRDFSAFDSTQFDRNKTVIQSQEFDYKKLVPLFYTAIICSLVRNLDTVPRLQKDRDNWKGLALHLTENTYIWGHLDLHPGKRVVFFQSKHLSPRVEEVEDGTFFAVGVLGDDGTSKVFDAYDKNGNRCAIKMYVDHFREEDNDYSAEEESNQQKEQPLWSIEVHRLQRFNPKLVDKVFSKILNGFPCVIMPFFQPLSNDEKKECADKMLECLARFVDEDGIHWMYQDGELWWNHVGMYEYEPGKREMIMFDLAKLDELEVFDGADEVETRRAHVDQLMRELDEPC